MRLLVATQNRHKIKEFSELLADLPDITWLSLDDVGLAGLDVAETGTTFAENAALKAQAYCQASGLVTMADDSGLIVDALDGAPGVYSARYGGPAVTTDRERYELLLKNLAAIPQAKRTARFACVVAIAVPGQPIEFAYGTVEGHIADGPRGNNGFGYDPVFLLPDGRTLAEYTSPEKNQISHRARALQAALPILRRVLGR
jgi:XTP/dITP diphosphohydrolase